MEKTSNEEYIGRIRSGLNEDAAARKEREKRRRKVLVDQMKAHEAQEVGTGEWERGRRGAGESGSGRGGRGRAGERERGGERGRGGVAGDRGIRGEGEQEERRRGGMGERGRGGGVAGDRGIRFDCLSNI